jgi:hypothetical protein
MNAIVEIEQFLRTTTAYKLKRMGFDSAERKRIGKYMLHEHKSLDRAIEKTNSYYNKT